VPTERGRSGSGPTSHLPGIFQSLIAAALGSSLFVPVKLGSARLFHLQLSDSVQVSIANGVAALILIPTMWLLTIPVRRFAARRTRATPKPKGDRFSIYVASFGEDELSEQVRDRVMDSILSELGQERVQVLPSGVALTLTQGVSRDEAAHDAGIKARVLLKENGGDLLIWGQIYAIPGEKTKVHLRFVSATQDGSVGKDFGFTGNLTLDPDFGPEMGEALVVVVSALAIPAVEDRGKYVAQVLVPVANRLAPLAHNMPASIRTDNRMLFFSSYGLIQSAIGEQSGESTRLEEAVAAYRAALREATRESSPLDWAATQHNLGAALSILGERDSGTGWLDEAVAAYREALKEWTRERVPLYWAATQNNLGTALSDLGERASGTGQLEDAIAACREALKEWTRERVPLDWATAQNNLGNALQRLGSRESGTGRLDEAVVAFREALKERTRERVPLHWAMTQNNLGTALFRLGERESGSGRLKEAVVAHREALKEWTRVRVPLDWAMTQNNLGNALATLGDRQRGAGLLRRAVAAYREALKEWTRERVPLYWAMAQNNLGTALSSLGARESGTGHLEEAVAAYRQALKEWTRERAPVDWARTQSNLGKALSRLGERERGTGRLEESVAAYCEALSVLDADAHSRFHSIALFHLNRVLKLLDARNPNLDE
jgi:tetratricopeptide (TPR) repeat protein